MDLIFSHNQSKKDRKSDAKSICNLELYQYHNTLEYRAIFDFDYHRYGKKKHVRFEHGFILHIENGDINISYRIVNDNLTDDKMFRNCYVQKKNNFKNLFELTENGFIRGEKRHKFWGVRYIRKTESMISLIKKILNENFNNDYNKDKTYDKFTINPLFDLLVDYHLDRKNIRGHDNVYFDIQNDYPKKRFLEKNDYKFLPALLDSYGIKSKYLISELNKHSGKNINISTLNYYCKLFGENHIDYIRQIPWINHCYDLPPSKKLHELKNETEKNCLVSVFNKWEKETLKSDSLIYNLYKIFSLRKLIEDRGVELKFKAKNDHEFESTMENWLGIKLHFARGFKVKYDFTSEFIKEIEDKIVIGDKTFDPKILISEEDFRVEGFLMKNCMSKQFPNGALYIYISLTNNKKRINLQYRKGNLVQSYGKANTPVVEHFFDAIEVLNVRMKKYKDLEWKKEKYDFLMN